MFYNKDGFNKEESPFSSTHQIKVLLYDYLSESNITKAELRRKNKKYL